MRRGSIVGVLILIGSMIVLLSVSAPAHADDFPALPPNYTYGTFTVSPATTCTGFSSCNYGGDYDFILGPFDGQSKAYFPVSDGSGELAAWVWLHDSGAPVRIGIVQSPIVALSEGTICTTIPGHSHVGDVCDLSDNVGFSPEGVYLTSSASSETDTVIRVKPVYFVPPTATPTITPTATATPTVTPTATPTITPTPSPAPGNYDVQLPSGQTGILEMRITAGDVIVAIGIGLLFTLQLFNAIRGLVQGARAR